ncbi:MAG: DUF423 domain-containing protein [Bacteroidota bacterium]
MSNLLSITAILGALAVTLGAFGAHGLEALVSPERIDIYQTGSRYHFYHLLPLFVTAAALAYNYGNRSWLLWAARLFLGGLLLFSGSLYLLALRDLVNFNIGWLGAITPLGGLLLIGGWLSLAKGLLPKLPH